MARRRRNFLYPFFFIMRNTFFFFIIFLNFSLFFFFFFLNFFKFFPFFFFFFLLLFLRWTSQLSESALKSCVRFRGKVIQKDYKCPSRTKKIFPLDDFELVYEKLPQCQNSWNSANSSVTLARMLYWKCSTTFFFFFFFFYPKKPPPFFLC